MFSWVRGLSSTVTLAAGGIAGAAVVFAVMRLWDVAVDDPAVRREALIGFKPDEVREFQKAKGLTVDGIAGPRTRAAMHKALASLSGPVPFGMSAPVTEIGVPDDIDRAVENRTGRASMAIGMIGAGSSAASALMGVEWQTVVVLAVTAIVIMGIVLVLRKQIVNAVNDIRKGLE